MTGGNFKKALDVVLLSEYESAMKDVTDEHEFSAKFEKKMKLLVNRRKKSYYNLINTVGKRVACAVAVLLIASSVTILSVESFRNKVAGFFVDIYKKFSVVQTDESADYSDAPTTIEDIYDITSCLDGFEVAYEHKDVQRYDVVYFKGEQVVYYTQHTIYNFNEGVNTEDAEISTIYINGHEAMYYFNNLHYYNAIWNNGEYIIFISTNISKDALIDMCESVQKVE